MRKFEIHTLHLTTNTSKNHPCYLLIARDVQVELLPFVRIVFLDLISRSRLASASIRNAQDLNREQHRCCCWLGLMCCCCCFSGCFDCLWYRKPTEELKVINRNYNVRLCLWKRIQADLVCFRDLTGREMSLPSQWFEDTSLYDGTWLAIYSPDIVNL